MGNSKGNSTPSEEVAIKLYPSWVKTLNHYSDLVLKIRITAITSGIIILAAAGTLLLREGNLTACRLVCVFGVLFSLVLLFMLKNYYKHYSDWLDLVTDMEEKMGLPDEMRAWTLYKKLREDRSEYKVKIVRYGCTMLIILAACFILLTTSFSNCGKRGKQEEESNRQANQVCPMNHEVVR